MAATATADVEPQRFTIRPNSLAQSMVLLVSLTAIQRVIGFGRSLLLCRWLPAEELGHWDLTFAFLGLAAPFAVLSVPSCFARYVEYYRHRGQLRMFLRRTSLAVFVLLGLSVALMYQWRSWFSHQLYGSDQGLPLVGLVLLTLPALIVFNSINELFGSLRMYRVVTILEFIQSFLFAGFAVTLAASWHAGADSVIIAYGMTCLVCSLFPLYWLTRMWSGLPDATQPQREAEFWGRLLPFIGSVWLINLLSSVFGMTERYMLLHYSGMTATEASMAVGQYHSARVVPLLIMQVAAMLATMFVPYLSHDWEAGRRDKVNSQLNMFLKVMGLGLTALSALVIVASPILFVGVFTGKFDGGEAILPWALLCAVWFSMLVIAKTYFWCDERVWLVGVGLVTGLGVNVLANLALLPRFGLLGAALAAAIANLALLLAVYGLAIASGMRLAAGTWLVSAVPVTLGLGPWVASAVLAALMLISMTTDLIFNREEKDLLTSFARDHLDRFPRRLARGKTAPDTVED